MAKYSRRKDGRYQYQFTRGYNSEGKRIMMSVYGRSVAELEAKIHAAKQDAGIEKRTETVPEYVERYINTYKAGTSENTRMMYKHSLAYHIKPLLSDTFLQEVTSEDIQKAINTLKDKRRTAEIMLLALKQAFAQAIKDGYIRRNPCDAITLPTKTKKCEKRALNASEKEALKSVSLPKREEAFLFILYGCGLRREEALGLRLCDITKDSVTVTQVVTFPDNAPVIKSIPKNESSARTVPIPLSCWEHIEPYIEERKQNAQNALIFNGITKTVYLRMWNKIKRAIGSDELTAHILRHNYATLLYYSGISIKKASELMGHADTKMILDVYAHLDEEQENVTEKLNAII